MGNFAAVTVSAIIGYLFGCLSPSALIAKIKRTDLRKAGTKNLGASNVTLTIGKKWGALVMVFDVLKGFAAYKLSARLFPLFTVAGLISGVFAIIGHIFPFYMKFKGGKGLAAFGGLILAYDPMLFLVLLTTGVIFMIIVNQSVALSYYAAIVAPIYTAIQTRSLPAVLLMTCASALVLWKHYENLKKAKTKSDVKIRDFIKKQILKK